MKFQLSYQIFLTLNFILHLSTKIKGNDDSVYYEDLYKKALLRPTTTEITIAMSDSNILQEIQVETLERFFYIGEYFDDFIDLLNTYKTLSYDPIEFNTDEITTLTSNYDDGSKQNRILTQFKVYRKAQEIRCTNYVVLKFILPKVESYLNDIAEYVYCMIEMSLAERFVVTGWLWKLHILLSGIQESKLDTQTFLNVHIPEINGILNKLITSCRKNKYLMKNFDYTLSQYNDNKDDFLSLKTFLRIYDEKYKRFFKWLRRFPNFEKGMIIDEWTLKSVIKIEITGLDFNWENSYNALIKEIENINNQHAKGEFVSQPFKYLKYYETLLDIIKAKLYSYIWIELVFFQKVGSEAIQMHVSFIQELYIALYFAYIEDCFLDKVLILLSIIQKPDHEKINETIDLLAKEVDVIMRKYTEPASLYEEANINYNFILGKFQNYYGFLHDHIRNFSIFFNNAKSSLSHIELNHLLCYIKGIKTNDFVFPNE